MDKNKKMGILGFLTGLGLGFKLVRTYDDITQDQSLSSKAVNNILASLNIKEKSELLLHEDLKGAIEKISQDNRAMVENPLALFVRNPRSYIYKGMEVLAWNKYKTGQDIIFYLHGGGYVFQPEKYQFVFIERLARRTRNEIIMPIYPKGPEFNYMDALTQLEKLYKSLDENTKIHFIGDSAGAGLALAFYYYLYDKGLRLPDTMTLICPWLNLSASNPNIEKAVENEIFFGMEGLNSAALAWAGGGDHRKDPYVSPLFGDPQKIKIPLLAYAATEESFYPDTIQWSLLLDDAKIPYELYIGKGEHHNYPMYPTLEGRKALERIASFMEDA